MNLDLNLFVLSEIGIWRIYGGRDTSRWRTVTALVADFMNFKHPLTTSTAQFIISHGIVRRKVSCLPSEPEEQRISNFQRISTMSGTLPQDHPNNGISYYRRCHAFHQSLKNRIYRISNEVSTMCGTLCRKIVQTMEFPDDRRCDGFHQSPKNSIYRISNEVSTMCGTLCRKIIQTMEFPMIEGVMASIRARIFRSASQRALLTDLQLQIHVLPSTSLSASPSRYINPLS
ncbi:hypothetical protein J6590_034048 [Homalodisca vitripennis]|nr:hypothetical protein J6590_034048 [Homalodisca vitripennis]